MAAARVLRVHSKAEDHGNTIYGHGKNASSASTINLNQIWVPPPGNFFSEFNFDEIHNNTPPKKARVEGSEPLSLFPPTNSYIKPITYSRGTPKHKRIGIPLNGRHSSSSSFRPHRTPTFSARRTGSLPFSFDAAMRGTISSYKPSNNTVATEAFSSPKNPTTTPKLWFFEVHEDTPEQEAANLMEHSVSTLDISSDDDSAAKRQNLEADIGKENVPPQDWCGLSASRRDTVAASGAHGGINSMTRAAEKEEKAGKGDMMQEGRSTLVALSREDFFPDGLNDKSIDFIKDQTTAFDYNTLAAEKKRVVERIYVRRDSLVDGTT